MFVLFMILSISFDSAFNVRFFFHLKMWQVGLIKRVIMNMS